eukprot:TRINITY_DN59504_c0_g2_i1.p1 TRINITY_DN59504_c0_g2~~TRINITY_DN59504_c0_g2_i1.p1  ORF type:complete len:262 (+),score=35.51 TRINITY_DN59504_c0_g2_i1:132-917(+)
MGEQPHREDLIFLAKLAEQAERWEEMASTMKAVVATLQHGEELSTEERNLVSVAFKNVVGARRAARRIVSSIEAKEAQRSRNNKHLHLIGQSRSQVEQELCSLCEDVLSVLDNSLIPNNSMSVESKVFFLKMKGDYHRYHAEVSLDEEPKTNTKDSNKEKTSAFSAYSEATELAVQLPPTHPTRLGLALNFSVFHYEMMNDLQKGCSVAKAAFDSAVEELDNLPEHEYKEAVLILSLLRDNLSLWKEQQPELEMLVEEAEA